MQVAKGVGTLGAAQAAEQHPLISDMERHKQTPTDICEGTCRAEFQGKTFPRHSHEVQKLSVTSVAKQG